MDEFELKKELWWRIHNLTDATTSNIGDCNNVIREKFSFLRTVIDRLDDATNFLNSMTSAPETDDGVLLYISYASIVYYGVKLAYETLKPNAKIPTLDESNEENYEIFSNIPLENNLCDSTEQRTLDDRFFEYLRAMTLAHPFETSKGHYKFLRPNETHYAPQLINSTGVATQRYNEPAIGCVVYSNKFEDIRTLCVPFRLLRKFIFSRYTLLTEIEKAIREIGIADGIVWQENEWLTLRKI